MAPSEPYFHLVKALLNTYLDGQAQEALDVSAMADHILERASIGSVIVSSLGKEDPEVNPKYASLPDAEFDKVCLKMNAQRDVYGFLSIVSLTHSRSKIAWLEHIYKYVMTKAETHCTPEHKLKELKNILGKKNVGLLVNERLINMPTSIAPELH